MAAKSPSGLGQTCTDKLHELRKEMIHEQEKEAIHKFRVTYKKMRALFRMMDVLEKGQGIKIKKGWKKIYRAAGAVRDNQLMQEMAAQQFGRKSLAEFLEGQEILHSKNLAAVLDDVDPGKMDFQQWKHPAEKDYDFYFHEMISVWMLQVLEPLYDDNLHALRKILKDIMYNKAWLDEMEVEPSALLTLLPADEIDRVQKLLGDNQDRVVQTNFIRKIAVLPILSRDSQMLEDWIQQSFNKSKADRHEIEKNIRALTAQFSAANRKAYLKS
ncbi:CHAD domain-containing protein [Flavihumibacter solisilvae]|uniref:CHAD domain-containing protein n=1 Tax=Flavihumibacter solisilvae TaxID=1349421 RepID=A0A0C1L6Y6_9BACT|nr:CHAD domain-containing protein [Flavihumibacter solisilvae]KIC95281.1 hypothetical protein OI18_06585 [Flavihumibacter solisilvae]